MGKMFSTELNWSTSGDKDQLIQINPNGSQEAPASAPRRPHSFAAMYLGLFVFLAALMFASIYLVVLLTNDRRCSTSVKVNIVNDEKILVQATPSVGDKVKGRGRIKYHVPKFMLELYERNKMMRSDEEVDIVRSLVPSQAEHLEDNVILDSHLLVFDLPASDRDERFVGAELKILTQVEINTDYEPGAKKILTTAIFDETSGKYRALRELHVHHFNDTWVSFDLTDHVHRALSRNATSSKFLKITVTETSVLRHSNNNLKLSLLPPLEDTRHDYPVLLLSYTLEDKTRQVTPRNRAKRSLEDDYEEETNRVWTDNAVGLRKYKRQRANSCRRRPLFVNFSEIEYDLWIVQPPGYEAYQCQGRCFYPVAQHLSPTKHAIMQALIHSVSPSKASRSCCVPTTLDPISILYVDDNGVLTYRYAYKDMVVVECGCR
ncbi:bone morphogenetic protein 10-like [Cylas formicarius]|uniref:bone morphogenetic protein 10-like n=1 Tax=Cylas formicarius TaxID=197179 RepID=UPI0029584C9D|nr:bone morphogenetic protein 10-like [Cylas formicarius]